METFLRAFENAPWGLVITPKLDGSCSCSFRSLPNSVNVREIVEDMDIGGGHDRAAGSTFKPIGREKVDPLDCYQKVKNWMNNHPQPI